MYEQLYHILPEVAMKETRSITVPPHNQFGVPTGEYGFVELYCTDADCDCRRVCIAVRSKATNSTVAVIFYGWESLDYYTKWFNKGKKIPLNEMEPLDQAAVHYMHGIHLSNSDHQSEIAPVMLKMLESYLREEKTYAKRLKRHYDLVRAKVYESA